MSLGLSVFEIVGSSYCFSPDDGQQFYNRVAAAIHEQQHVVLSFHNITIVTAAFLNTAVGQLYGSFTEEKIRSHLTVQGLETDDLALMKLTVATAKQYFVDKRGRDWRPAEGAI